MNLPFSILFQNNHFIIINKPAGMPVYTHTKHHSVKSVEDYFPYLSKRKDGPWLVHRLDQDTAGCLLIALRKHALIQAQECFKQHKVQKIYWAIVEGKPKNNYGIINVPLSKITRNHQWKIQEDPKGQNAITKWKVLKTVTSFSLLELNLLTGRTHQARAHCAILGHPIIGDKRYGSHYTASSPLHLLSRHLMLPLKDVISATAHPPDHMMSLLNTLKI